MEKETYLIRIIITVGEYEHDEETYFLGTKEEADTWADNYLRTIWGEDNETFFDDTEGAWSDRHGHRMASLSGIYGPMKSIYAKSARGDALIAIS